MANSLLFSPGSLFLKTDYRVPSSPSSLFLLSLRKEQQGKKLLSGSLLLGTQGSVSSIPHKPKEYLIHKWFWKRHQHSNIRDTSTPLQRVFPRLSKCPKSECFVPSNLNTIYKSFQATLFYEGTACAWNTSHVTTLRIQLHTIDIWS